MKRGTWWLPGWVCLAVWLIPSLLHAQIDSSRRELIQFGYNQPLQGKSPIGAYAFYFLNQPHFYSSNVALRLAIAPVFLHSEVGFRELFGPNTHFGVGLEGGGFADGFSEIRGGKYWREESFTGHGGGVSANAYHKFNPGQRIPLYAVLKNEFHYATFSRDEDTAPGFQLPHDIPSHNTRAGLRWGGREPLMRPDFAMELSAWYDGDFRFESGPYGFAGDRRVNPRSHLFYTRALGAYTFKNKDNVALNISYGNSVSADRLHSYRLGGVLPLASEFPLSLPGYYHQEITAKEYILFGASYAVSLHRDWFIQFQGATAHVDYLPGLEQPGRLHSGLGTGVGYTTPGGSTQVILSYGYGFDAIRKGGRGAHAIGLLFQYDFGKTRFRVLDPGESPFNLRGLDRILRF